MFVLVWICGVVMYNLWFWCVFIGYVMFFIGLWCIGLNYRLWFEGWVFMILLVGIVVVNVRLVGMGCVLYVLVCSLLIC